MDFKEATDFLFQKIDHECLARELGVSVAAVRQARLKPSAKAHRSPPPNWDQAVTKLASDRLNHYKSFLKLLETSTFPLDKQS